MGRYDTAVRCAQIENLIEENQYLRAMEEIEELEFDKVPSISDLYMFAELFLKAEKLDVAKELYYTVYRRTASRPALYRLLMLVIRMGDIEEAKELYLAYEIISGLTLDTYELRYRLAKAEGEPRARLIEILEQLKADEYTEEWGFQLAKLYELEGMREKCIEECEDIKRWFGTGSIVKKAEELREKCMSPMWVKPSDEELPEPEVPEPEEEPVSFAQAPVHVEEIPTQMEPEQEEEPEESEHESEGILGDAVEEELPEEEEAEEPEDESEEILEDTVGEELPEEEEAEESEDESEEILEETAEEETVQKKGFLKRLVDYFKVDLDTFDDDDFPQELDTYKQQSTAELNVKEILAQGVDEIMEEGAGTTEEMVVAEAAAASQEVLQAVSPAKAPMESLEDRLQEMEEHKQVINLEDTMNLEGLQTKSHPLGNSGTVETYEDVSRNGIRYITLKGAIYKIQQEEGVINFALSGGEEGISLAVAKKLFKELKKINYFEAKNIGKIAADKLDEVNLEEWAEKFIGGCMYIIDAPNLSENSVANLLSLMDKYQRQIVIILEGSYDEMDSFLKYHKEFEKRMTYKIKL